VSTEKVVFVGFPPAVHARLDHSRSHYGVETVGGTFEDVIESSERIASSGLTVLYPDWRIYVPEQARRKGEKGEGATEAAQKLCKALLGGVPSRPWNRYVFAFDPLGQSAPASAVPFVTASVGFEEGDLLSETPYLYALIEACALAEPMPRGLRFDPRIYSGQAGWMGRNARPCGVLRDSVEGACRGLALLRPDGPQFLLLPVPQGDGNPLELIAPILRGEFGIEVVTEADTKAYRSYVKATYQERTGRPFPMVGGSMQLASFYQDLVTASLDPDGHVLILGETGTGKESAGEILHHVSLRWKGRYLTTNCAGLTRHLAHSQLFGHVKGAFTGALENKEGLVAEADRGTLFLDEIHALDTNVRNSLLRFLQDGTYHRLGEEKVVKQVDVRIIGATNDASFMDKEGAQVDSTGFMQRFTHSITLPPLNDRREDIPGLIACFVKEAGDELLKLEFHTDLGGEAASGLGRAEVARLTEETLAEIAKVGTAIVGRAEAGGSAGILSAEQRESFAVKLSGKLIDYLGSARARGCGQSEVAKLLKEAADEVVETQPEAERRAALENITIGRLVGAFTKLFAAALSPCNLAVFREKGMARLAAQTREYVMADDRDVFRFWEEGYDWSKANIRGLRTAIRRWVFDSLGKTIARSRGRLTVAQPEHGESSRPGHDRPGVADGGGKPDTVGAPSGGQVSAEEMKPGSKKRVSDDDFRRRLRSASTPEHVFECMKDDQERTVYQSGKKLWKRLQDIDDIETKRAARVDFDRLFPKGTRGRKRPDLPGATWS
jgi:hypothetical protein